MPRRHAVASGYPTAFTVRYDVEWAMTDGSTYCAPVMAHGIVEAYNLSRRYMLVIGECGMLYCKSVTRTPPVEGNPPCEH